MTREDRFLCLKTLLWACILIPLITTGCNSNPQPTVNVKTRVATIPPPPETQELLKPSPKEERVPASLSERVPSAFSERVPAVSNNEDEFPYYGSTFWDEVLTSAYYYPQGGADEGTPDEAATHLKFAHREDDLWLCGDQRRKFEPGKRYRMLATFEPNHICATNWKIQ